MLNNNTKRKPNRLKDYDYSSVGTYFITICTKDRQNLFWSDSYEPQKADGYTEFLSDLGNITYKIIMRTDVIYDDKIKIDKFVIMPNHIHLLLTIYDIKNAMGNPNIPQIIKQLKRKITIESAVKDIWQKGYHDHIIRNEQDYNEIWDYIDNNPRLLTKNIFLT